MQIKLTRSGVLQIEGETPLEDYALKRWYEGLEDGNRNSVSGSRLEILIPDPNKPTTVIPHPVRKLGK